MLKKFYRALALISLIQLAGLLGLAAYIVGAGKLDKDQLDRIAQVWREGPDQEEADEADDEQPADEPADLTDVQPRTANRRLMKISNDTQRLHIQFDQARREIRNQKESVERKLHEARGMIEELQKKLKVLEEMQRVTPDDVRAEFTRNLEQLRVVAPGTAKDRLIDLPKPLAIKYLRALQSDKRKFAAIVEEFKTPEEKDVYREWWLDMNRIVVAKKDETPSTESGEKQ